MLLLTPAQIETFVRDGLLVVDNFLSAAELQDAHDGLAATLARFGVRVDNLADTAGNLATLSSTNGSGGVLDIFYEEWKFKIALNAQLFAWTRQLWEAAYCQRGEALHELESAERFKWHPYGAFDCNKGFAYIDRICYRLPTTLSDEIGDTLSAGTTTSTTNRKKARKKRRGLQRSLTPHLDCCPDTFDDLTNSKAKWRPIQCFVSLTDNLEPNTGGFEAAKGFHKEFRSWTQSRPPTVAYDEQNDEHITTPPPCMGEYTHMRPKQDADVLQRVQHVPVRAGSVVFWDYRLPHANAYRHDGCVPRAVLYCSFLPPVPLNRTYAQRQLERWRQGKTPTDQWIQDKNTTDETTAGEETVSTTEPQLPISDFLKKLPKHAQCLLAAEEWPEFGSSTNHV